MIFPTLETLRTLFISAVICEATLATKRKKKEERKRRKKRKAPKEFHNNKENQDTTLKKSEIALIRVN